MGERSRRFFRSNFSRFIARAFCTTLLWVVISFLFSEFMPLIGLGLVDSSGQPTKLKFIEFVDWRLWLLTTLGASGICVAFGLLKKIDEDADTAMAYGALAVKEDVFSMCLTFASVLLIIFVRGGFSGKMLMAAIGNYFVAFLLFRLIQLDKEESEKSKSVNLAKPPVVQDDGAGSDEKSSHQA